MGVYVRRIDGRKGRCGWLGRTWAVVALWVLAIVTQGAWSPGVAAQVNVRPAMAPDGDRIAFETDMFGGSDIVWMSLAGGRPQRITRNGGGNRNVTWSPSGDRVAFASDRAGSWQIYVQVPGDSVATQVTHLDAGASDPDFAPDGTRLLVTAEVDSVRQLFEVDLSTGTATQLTSTPGNKTEPAYSPVGDRIAFLTDASGGREIAVAESDGSGERRITSFAEKEKRRFVNGLGWTPEGRLIFAANRGVGGLYFFNPSIYTLAPDGSDLQRIVGDPQQHNNPSMARDGSWIAFDSFRYGGRNVFVVRPDGRELRKLTAMSAFNAWLGPTPDGERVVFVSAREGQGDIYIMDRDGTDVHNLTQNPEDDRGASLSPDGRTITFVSFRASEWGDVYTMDLDGGNVTKVTPDGFFEKLDQFALHTALTPDGRTILFESAPVLVQGEAHWDIWRINRDGSGARRLTNTSGAHRTSAPVISPDGKSFLYFSDESGAHQVYRMSIDGGPPVQLSHGPGAHRYPAWSPSGDAIYYTSQEDGQGDDVYRMDADGSNIRRLTHRGPGAYSEPKVDAAGRNLWAASWDNGRYNVHRLDLDGTHELRLTGPWGPTADDPATSGACTGFTNLGQPHWSWWRNEIVFPGDCGGAGRSLFVYSVDNGTLRKLDVDVGTVNSPRWSHRGDRIAFTSVDGNRDRDLYIYDVASKRTERITTGNTGGGWVTWSPDDLWLNGYGPNHHGSSDIFRIGADGSEQVRVNRLRDANYFTLAESPRGGVFLYAKEVQIWRMTSESSPEMIIGGGAIAAVMPRWAPDGRRYIFDGSVGPGWNLYLADERLRGEPIPLTERSEWGTNGSWSPDGRRVVYDCRMGKITTLCIVDVATRRSLPLFLPGG